jgi:hypothetical protein
LGNQAPNFGQAERLLISIGLDQETREKFLDQAIKDALEEVVNSLNDKLSSKSRLALLQIIKK